jgi:hypothetical protein
MKTNFPAAGASGSVAAMPLMDGFLFKTIAIYPHFADVGDALLQLNNAGFTMEQISLLGQEQEHWQENLGREWDTFSKTKKVLGGAALGAIPGLVLVSGIALTGGVGLLVMGPMVAGLSALGMGALCGGVMGTKSDDLKVAAKTLNVEDEVAEAITQGQWVIVVHSHTEEEARQIQALLPNRRIVRESERTDVETTRVAAEQLDIQMLSKVVEEALEPVAKLTELSSLEVMRNVEKIDMPELKQAAREAARKISVATDLDTGRVTDIFRANAGAGIGDVVKRLHDKSRINRNPW